jgi:hypothetical protein
MIGVTFGEDTYGFCFVYRNWRGEVSTRHARPVRMFYGATFYHPEAQWLMEMVDLDKGETRIFAMKDMRHPAGVGYETIEVGQR